MIRLHIALANLRYRLHRRPLRLRYRRARYLLWANTRQERPVRRLMGHEDELHAAVLAKRADEARGIRYVNGAIRDRDGRFAALSEGVA